MRWFWAMLAGLLLVAFGVVWISNRPPSGGDESANSPGEQVTSPRPVAVPGSLASESDRNVGAGPVIEKQGSPPEKAKTSTSPATNPETANSGVGEGAAAAPMAESLNPVDSPRTTQAPNPSQASRPVEASQPGDAIKPAEPTTPAEGIKPAETGKAGGATQPAQASKPVDASTIKTDSAALPGAKPTPSEAMKELFPDIAAPAGTATEGAGTGAPAAKTETDRPFQIAAHEVYKADKIVAARAVQRADGSIVLDDRFVVKGSGTASDPFLVPWDLLVSAQETYKPRLGQTKLPQRVTMLDGKFVKISGYIAFPITSNNPKEMLSMLNQWDGCCIGVPPTAYDAIEVKLAATATASQKFAVHGTLVGKLRVDPYEDGGWLLGLYLMEDGKLTIDQ